MPLPKGKDLTRLIVSAVIGAGIIFYLWVVPLPLWIRIGCTILLIYEAITLTNKEEGDTLTEGLEYLAGVSHLVPFLFGIVFGYLIGKGILIDPLVIGGIFFLMGHFFFSQRTKLVKAIVEVTENKNG